MPAKKDPNAPDTAPATTPSPPANQPAPVSALATPPTPTAATTPAATPTTPTEPTLAPPVVKEGASAADIIAAADRLAAGSGDAPPFPPDDVQAAPDADPRRRGAPEALSKLPSTFFDSMDRLSDNLHAAKSLTDVTKALRTALDDMAAIAKGPDVVDPLDADKYVEETITVAGEGHFVVRKNKLGFVELHALQQIGGTGIMKGDNFGEVPDLAVRYVVAGAASPRQNGGVRRARSAPGEEGASAA